jgi:hypothetical protein
MLRALFIFLSSSSSSSGFLDWWIKHRYDEDWILNHSLHYVSYFILFIWRKGLNVKHKTNQTSQTFGYENQTKKADHFGGFFLLFYFIEWYRMTRHKWLSPGRGPFGTVGNVYNCVCRQTGII